MKITFILPAIGKKKDEKYIKTWKKMEPLVISTLKSITPKDIETEFFDDRLELINYDTNTDLVMISVEMYTSRRAYIIAEKFRNKNVKVMMGGYHVTLMSDEVVEHADSILIGNAEKIWTEVINDLKNNSLKKKYYGNFGFERGIPDRSIFKEKKYSPIGLVETGRGCIFHCEFCAITACYSGKYHKRNIEDIVEDIKSSGKKYFFFVDDNIVADQNYTIELLKAIEPLNIRWSAQGSLTMAKNDELLSLMKKSGCDVILIGYESVNRKNLEQMKKDWSLSLGERDTLTEKIHSYGINIYATFVFGFDYDDDETFEETLRFAFKHNFFFAAFNHLLPFPGTELHERFVKENRLLKDKWWLDENYSYGDIPYKPKNMTAEELSEKCADARRKFFTYSSIFKRFSKLLFRKSDLMLWLIFLTQNINLKKEVDGKLRLPLGSGLDENPK